MQRNHELPYYATRTQSTVERPVVYRPKPFLARHPWVGYLIFVVCTAAYVWVSWQVNTNGPIARQDLPRAQAIYKWAKAQSLPVVLVMRFLSMYGRDGVALIALVLTIGWVKKKARRELHMLFFGVLAGELWFQVLGNLVRRPRPSFKDPFETLIGFGYPSGHAVTNILLAWMILYLLLPHIRSKWNRVWVTLAVLGVTAGIGASRMFLGLHYPTDMIAGYLLGLAWGGLVYTTIDVIHWRKKNVPAKPALASAASPERHHLA